EVGILVELFPATCGARVLRLFHPGVELRAQIVLRRRVRRLPSNVLHLVWIGSQVVEFLRRPLLERERKELREFRLAAARQNELLAWRRVAIAERADRL